MSRAYSHAGPDRKIECKDINLELELPQDPVDGMDPVPKMNDEHTRGGIQSMSLIPGGRYLLVLYPNWLTVWDLRDTAHPCLCLKHPISSACAAFDLLLDGPDRLYVMLENGLLPGEMDYLRYAARSA